MSLVSLAPQTPYSLPSLSEGFKVTLVLAEDRDVDHQPWRRERGKLSGHLTAQKKMNAASQYNQRMVDFVEYTYVHPFSGKSEPFR